MKFATFWGFADISKRKVITPQNAFGIFFLLLSGREDFLLHVHSLATLKVIAFCRNIVVYSYIIGAKRKNTRVMVMDLWSSFSDLFKASLLMRKLITSDRM